MVSMPRSSKSSKFVCTSCGFQSPKWLGKCPQCSEWNTMQEEFERDITAAIQGVRAKPVILSEVPLSDVTRFSSGMSEFDRVLGGGLVPGAVILLAGEPGIGKSTLLLSVAEHVSKQAERVFYTSGEESQGQVKLRADRMGVKSDRLFFASTQDVDQILELCRDLKARLLIVDSIQTCEDPSESSLPGGPTQVRTCATKLQQFAKTEGVTVIMVGHTVKAGGIAGPRLLEHLVDAVLYFEGDLNHFHRIVKAQKNRFGATNEVAVFQMEEKGMVQVPNPSSIFLSERSEGNVGSCVAATLKGNQPICVEVQALVAASVYGTPRRVTSEIDHQRASLILAVLAKKLAAGLDSRDAFVKIAGGIGVDEPGIDLSCAISTMSSYHDIPVKPALACFGEIGLSGEVRMVPRMEDRVKEAARIGFGEVMVPMGFRRKYRGSDKIIGVSSVEEAVRNALVKPLK